MALVRGGDLGQPFQWLKTFATKVMADRTSLSGVYVVIYHPEDALCVPRHFRLLRLFIP